MDTEYNPSLHADPGAGPCHREECPGQLLRAGVAHGGDVYSCTECDLRTTTTRAGN